MLLYGLLEKIFQTKIVEVIAVCHIFPKPGHPANRALAGVAPGKKLVGIVGMGMLAVVPQECVDRSSAMAGALYPVGGVETVVVETE